MSVFIVAEAGVNFVERLPDDTVSHRPDLGLYRKNRSLIIGLIEAASRAGADAAKFQAFSAAALIERRGIDPNSDTAQLLRAAELDDNDLDLIAEEAKANKIKYFWSVFDPSQIERVLSRGACALKIGHAESEYRELISACWHAGPRVWQSTRLCEPGRGHVWCIAEYPAVSEPHLGYVGELGFSGFSSHYTDYRIPAAAALRGAEYIEAHLMLGDRLYAWNGSGDRIGPYTTDEPEREWSLSPYEFGAMVKLIREYSSWL